MKKFAIYTALIGGYDSIQQPKVIDDQFDYYLFTDDIQEKEIGIWKVRRVEYTNTDKTRIARYVKTHPHRLLPEYDATLWMDANVQIISSKIYDRFIYLSSSNIDVASIYHPFRDCIYDEAFEVSYSKRYGRLEHDVIAINWCHYLFQECYPSHNGLFETNILFRKNTESVNVANDLWWECINDFSKRDQLSCNYVLWKYQLKLDDFLPQGEHAQHSYEVRYIPHEQVSRRKLVNADVLEQWRYKTVNLSNWTLKMWQRVWRKASESNKPFAILNVYGLAMGLLCSPHLLFNVIKHRITKIINNYER